MKHFIKCLVFLLLCQFHTILVAEDGYRLWMRYDIIDDASLLSQYRTSIQGWMIKGESETLQAAKDELKLGLNGLLGSVPEVGSVNQDGILVAGTPASSSMIRSLNLEKRLQEINEEGYLIFNTTMGGRTAIVIAANEDIGVLYDTFHLLRLLQTHQSMDEERYKQVQSHLNIQEKDAVLWRDACILYFQTFSQRPLPDGVEKPEHTLDYYRKLRVFYVR